MNATARVLTGLAAGALAGLLLAATAPAFASRAAAVVQPFGRLWLEALQMPVVPLVLALVVVGVNTAADAAASGRIARRALVVFLALLAFGAALAALLAPLLFGLFPPQPALADVLRHAAPATVPAAPVGWADALLAVIPTNPLNAAAQGAMLPLVVFALFMGFAVTRLEPARRQGLVGFFQALAAAMTVIVRWVLAVAPLGVFALMFALGARAGAGMLGALGLYVLVESLIYLLAGLAMLPIAVYGGRLGWRRFVSAAAPAQAVAASTQSSLAALPAMLEGAGRLGLPGQVGALVLPMAVSLLRLTSPVQYLTSAAFIAWALGVPLAPGTLVAGAALAVVISLGSIGLPGQVTFIATNLPVAQAMGVPTAPLGLMLAVDALPDVLATVGNVTADLAAAALVARRSAPDAEAVPAARYHADNV